MTSAIEENLHDEDMGAQCKSCGGRTFRRSRLKPSDGWGLLVLRYPVRCLSCSIRQTVPLRVAARAVSSKTRQVRASQGHAPHDADSQTKPSAVGGSKWQEIAVQEKMAMPNLHGVTLKHISSLPINESNPKQ